MQYRIPVIRLVTFLGRRRKDATEGRVNFPVYAYLSRLLYLEQGKASETTRANEGMKMPTVYFCRQPKQLVPIGRTWQSGYNIDMGHLLCSYWCFGKLVATELLFCKVLMGLQNSSSMRRIQFRFNFRYDTAQDTLSNPRFWIGCWHRSCRKGWLCPPIFLCKGRTCRYTRRRFQPGPYPRRGMNLAEFFLSFWLASCIFEPWFHYPHCLRRNYHSSSKRIAMIREGIHNPHSRTLCGPSWNQQ